VRKIIAVNNAG